MDVGIKNAATGAILLNKCTFDVYNEKSSKYIKKEMELYKYKAGDTIRCGYNVYEDASSDDNAVEGDTESSTEDNSGYVDEETINNGVRKTVDVTIAGVTDKAPIGYKGCSNTTHLFMNQKGFESLWADGKSDNELKPGNATYSAYVVAENADEYRDTLEKERKKILSIPRLVFMSAIWISRCAMKNHSLHCLEYLHTDLLWSLP